MKIFEDISHAAAVHEALLKNTAVLEQLLKVLTDLNKNTKDLSLNIQRMNNKM